MKLSVLAVAMLFVSSFGQAQAGSVTRECGGQGGNDFASESPDKVGLRYGKFIDGLVLNGRLHGGNGGNSTPQLELDPGDYWTEVVVRAGKFVDFISLRSKDGKVVQGGGDGGDYCLNLKNVKVVSLGGKQGTFLDNLRVEYLENYSAAKERAAGSWQLVCSGICDQEMTTGMINSNGTKETNVTERTKSSFKASMKVSVFEGGGTGDTSGSALSETTKRALETNFDTTTSESITKRVHFTPQQMQTMHIDAVWQWVMRNNTSVWKSSFMACTPNDIAPNWTPGMGHPDGCANRM